MLFYILLFLYDFPALEVMKVMKFENYLLMYRNIADACFIPIPESFTSSSLWLTYTRREIIEYTKFTNTTLMKNVQILK